MLLHRQLVFTLSLYGGESGDILVVGDDQKSRPLRGRLWAAWLAKSSGEEG